MADQELREWASTITLDDIYSQPQRNDIRQEVFVDGWLYNHPVGAQDLNQILNLLTKAAPPTYALPQLYPDSAPIPSVAVEMLGQSIIESEMPNAYALYGDTLPDLSTSAPAGFTYIIRKS